MRFYSEVHAATMKRVFKIIAVASILTLSALVNSYTGVFLHAQDARDTSTDSDLRVCMNALDLKRTAWDQKAKFSRYIAEAKRRRFAVDTCRQIVIAAANQEQRPNRSCTGPLSDARMRNYGNEVAADMRKQGTWALPGVLSLDGVLQDFWRRIIDKIYNTDGGLRVQQPYNDAMAKANLDMLQACFPGLEELLVAKRQRIREEENAKAEAAAAARKPLNRLLTGYKRYAFVKYCNEVRQGYALVYVNDIELVRARTAVKAIEDDAVHEDSNLDSDAVWRMANTDIKGEYVDQYQCQLRLNELLQQSAAIHPENSIIQKDF